jgi:hypothetical protein
MPIRANGENARGSGKLRIVPANALRQALLMTWYTIRLDLARSAEHPDGSASRCYLLRAPLTDQQMVDARALHAHPDRATVLRSVPDAPEQRGYLIGQNGKWRFSYAAGEEDDEPIFHLETHSMALGAYLTIQEQGGQEQCFKVVQCDAIAEPT